MPPKALDPNALDYAQDLLFHAVEVDRAAQSHSGHEQFPPQPFFGASNRLIPLNYNRLKFITQM
jgi:hypothetical protein